jgi:hypothetical protein
MRYNAPEWHIIVIGCICSIIYGGFQPISGILYGSILGVSSLLIVAFKAE